MTFGYNEEWRFGYHSLYENEQRFGLFDDIMVEVFQVIIMPCGRIVSIDWNIDEYTYSLETTREQSLRFGRRCSSVVNFPID